MAEASDLTRSLPARPTGRVLSAAEAKAWQDGFQFLGVAKGEAKELRTAARQAYAGEYSRGFEDGKAEGDAEAARIVAETTAKVDRYLGSLENDVVALALDVARRVFGAFDNEELVARAARQAVSEMRRAKYVKVTVHPTVAEAVRAQLADVAENADAGFSIEVLPDSTLSPQACIVATDIAVMDASVESQLRGIEKALGKGKRRR